MSGSVANASSAWLQTYPLLGRHGATTVGVELLFLDLAEYGADVADAVGVEEPAAPVGKELHLVGRVDAERVDLVRRHPGDVVVDGLVGELDAFGVHARCDSGDLHRLLGDPDRLGRGENDAGGEAPCSVADHPNGEATVFAVVAADQLGVAQGEVLRAVAFHAEVDVFGTQLTGPRQRGVGEGAERAGLGSPDRSAARGRA